MKEEIYILEVTEDELIAIGAEILATKAYNSKLQSLRTFCKKVDKILKTIIK